MILLYGSIAAIGTAGVMALHNYGPTMTRTNLYVAEVIGDWDYLMVDSDNQRIFVRFCRTMPYQPPFDEGETILELKFKNRGTCWEPMRYRMLRDEKGELIRGSRP